MEIITWCKIMFLLNHCLLRPVYESTIYSDMNARNVVPCNALSMTPLWSYQWLLDRKGPDPKIMLSICPPGLSLLIRFMSSCPHIYIYYCKYINSNGTNPSPFRCTTGFRNICHRLFWQVFEVLCVPFVYPAPRGPWWPPKLPTLWYPRHFLLFVQHLVITFNFGQPLLTTFNHGQYLVLTFNHGYHWYNAHWSHPRSTLAWLSPTTVYYF